MQDRGLESISRGAFTLHHMPGRRRKRLVLASGLKDTPITRYRRILQANVSQQIMHHKVWASVPSQLGKDNHWPGSRGRHLSSCFGIPKLITCVIKGPQ